MASTALTGTFRVSSAPCNGDYCHTDTFAGPDVGDSAEFRGFINTRWQEAQARGHAEMIVTRVAIPELNADDFPGIEYELAQRLASAQYDSAADILDAVPAIVQAHVEQRAAATAEVVFMCKRGNGVHLAISFWKPAAERVVVTILQPEPAGAPPAKTSTPPPAGQRGPAAR